MAWTVAADISTRAEATAVRVVIDLSLVSTMRARPSSSTWVSLDIVRLERNNRRGRRGWRRGGRVIIAIDDASNSITQMQCVEVEYQCQSQVRQLYIGENLCEVNIVDGFDSFDFQNEPMLNHNVNAITAIELHL